MSLEIIINYTKDSSESQLDKTLKSLKKFAKPSIVSICVHPPYSFRNRDRYIRKLKYYFKSVGWNMHLLVEEMPPTKVINFAAEKSNEKYYLFVNAGYEIKDNILKNLEEGDVFFIDPEDELYNGFVCNNRLHRYLLGFGDEYTLIQKIEMKLKQLEEAKNAASTT